MGILQEDWDSVLDDEKQQKKFKLSLTPSFAPSYLSKESYAGTFVGETKAIVCYLGKHRCCNCDEYAKTDNSVHYPCPHMYRLAYEFGLVNADGKLYEDNTAVSYSVYEKKTLFKDAVFRVEKYIPTERQLNLTSGNLYYTISRCIKDNTRVPFRIKASDAKDYILSGLFEQCFFSNIGIIYDYGFASDIAKKMDDNGHVWPENLAKTKRGSVTAKAKKDWCLTHPDESISIAYPDGQTEYIMIRPTEIVIPVWDDLLQYWERKFNDEETCEKFGRYMLCHPVGAVVSDYKRGCYSFPADMITEELNRYGHNRCITRKTGVGKGRLYRERTSSFSFSIARPNHSEFETLFSLLVPIASYYNEINSRNDISAFIKVVSVLGQLDKFMNSAADNSIAMLAIARSELSKYIKSEDEIKSDFLNCRIILWNGKDVLGYENIHDGGFTEDQIKAVVFASEPPNP